MSEIRNDSTTRTNTSQATGAAGPDKSRSTSEPDAASVKALHELAASTESGVGPWSASGYDKGISTVLAPRVTTSAQFPAEVPSPLMHDARSALADALESKGPEVGGVRLKANMVATEIRSRAPETASLLDATGDGLELVMNNIDHGEIRGVVPNLDRVVRYATQAADSAPAGVKDSVVGVLEEAKALRTDSESEMVSKAIDFVTARETLERLGVGDYVQLEIAAKLDLQLVKAGVRAKVGVRCEAGPDGKPQYIARLDAQGELAAERGKGKELGGALGVGVELKASSPEEAAALASRLAELASDEDVLLQMKNGDFSCLSDVTKHLHSVSTVGEVAGKLEGKRGVELEGVGEAGLTGEVKARVLIQDTYYFNEEGHVDRVQRDRIHEVSGQLSAGAKVGTEGANAKDGVNTGALAASITIRRTWKMDKEGLGLADLAKMGAENVTLGVFSADADEETVSVSIPTGDNETTTASWKTKDPGFVENLIDMVWNGKSLDDIVNDQTVELKTTKWEETSLSIGGEGFALTLEGVVTAHDEVSTTTRAASLKDVVRAVVEFGDPASTAEG